MKPLLGGYLLVSIGLLALVLYMWVLVVSPPKGFEWIAVGIIFLFPILLLRQAYHRRR
jgi:hypothetical protein